MRLGHSNTSGDNFDNKSEICQRIEDNVSSDKEKHNFDDADVDVFVTKYKRAASFLWILLHSLVCIITSKWQSRIL